MSSLELERTFLVKYLPEDLNTFSSKEIIDVYLLMDIENSKMRLRKCGDEYEITKKEMVDKSDASEQIESTIKLSKEEFEQLVELSDKKVHKIRYYYKFGGAKAEIDIFLDELKGLVLIDFEFDDKKSKDLFTIPDFCLADVTNENFIAGGKLCGKYYEDIKENLDKFNYKKIV
jgi:CYTH domain-containing protein